MVRVIATAVPYTIIGDTTINSKRSHPLSLNYYRYIKTISISKIVICLENQERAHTNANKIPPLFGKDLAEMFP